MSATATPKASKKAAPAPTYGDTIDIPKGCKPSKVVSQDFSRPILNHAYLRRRDGDLWLCATDSYIAVAIKVRGEAQEGFIPIGALRLMEGGQKAEQISATAWKVKTRDGVITFDIAEKVDGAVAYPDFTKLGVWSGEPNGSAPSGKFEAIDNVTVGINPDLMKRLGDGMGAKYNGCRFELTAPLRPIRVTPLSTSVEAVGLQMPIRVNV